MLATVAIMVVSTAGLIAFHLVARPDVQGYRAFLPLESLGRAFVGGAIFSLLNATLEELVFRGVLFDAMETQWKSRGVIVITSVLFALGHLHGYPPGMVGAALALLYGFVLGWLRNRTGGLLLPILAHVSADATIYGILIYAGA